MKQVKADIFNALKNTNITTQTGWIPTNATFPCIAFYQTAGTNELIDGKMQNETESYSIDIFAKSMIETEDILNLVDNELNKLDYLIVRTLNQDLYEQDTKIFHKVLRYQIKAI